MAIVALFIGSLLGMFTAGAVAITGASLAMIFAAYLTAGLLTASLLLAQGLWGRGDY